MYIYTGNQESSKHTQQAHHSVRQNASALACLNASSLAHADSSQGESMSSHCSTGAVSIACDGLRQHTMGCDGIRSDTTQHRAATGNRGGRREAASGTSAHKKKEFLGSLALPSTGTCPYTFAQIGRIIDLHLTV